MKADHVRTRERLMALYEICNGKSATKVGKQTGRNPQTIMDWVHRYNYSGKEALLYKRTGGSVHKSSLARQQHQRWQQQGLYVFFLPPYSPQMNRIEDEWLHLLRDELAGQVFEDEYELAIAIIDGINNRANHGQYQVERFTFN